MPELLIDPAREECGDLGVGGDARGEEVTQVDDRVRLDVHHVVEAHHVAVAQRVIRDRGPVDSAQVDLLGITQVSVEIELDECGLGHASPPGAVVIRAPGRRSPNLRRFGATGSQICGNSRRPGSHAAARRVRYRDDEHPVASGSPNNGSVSGSAGTTLRTLGRRLNWRGLGPSMVREDLVAIGFLVAWDRLPLWAFEASPLAGTTVVSLAVYFSGPEAATAYALFYLWVALAACYFLRPPVAFTHLGIASAAYALVLVVSPGHVMLPGLTWAMVTGT